MANTYTESNMIGNLRAPITSTATSWTATMIDRITGEARAPQTTTVLWVIDKGTATNPNPNWELVYAEPSTTAGVTTFSNAVRGLNYYGSNVASGNASNRKAHTANAEIGTVDIHFLWNILTDQVTGNTSGATTLTFKVYATEAARDSDITSPTNGMACLVTGTKTFYFRVNGVWYGTACPVYADTAARDAAIPSPVNGMSCYVTADGVFYDYQGGAWTTRASGATPNMSITVAGKAEEATAAEIIANTQTGGTGAELAVNPKYLSDASVTTSAGAADAGKYVRANGSGLVDSTLLPTNNNPIYTTVSAGNYYMSGTAGETLAAGDWVYVKASDGKLYKAANTSDEAATVVGVIITGGAANATVYYQFGGVYTTSGLTDGANQYLSTGGAKTETHPSMSSSSVIPVKLGRASGTTKLILNITRLQRRVLQTATRAYSDGNGTQTITVGFPISYVTIETHRREGDATEQSGVCHGFYDNIAGTQGMTSNASNITNPPSSTQCAFAAQTSGSGSMVAVGGTSGNNFTLTWTVSGSSINADMVIVAYESL